MGDAGHAFNHSGIQKWSIQRPELLVVRVKAKGQTQDGHAHLVAVVERSNARRAAAPSRQPPGTAYDMNIFVTAA